jgi:hypothetical protein
MQCGERAVFQGVFVDMELAMQRFLGQAASPARLTTARHIGREIVEAWRSGRITTAQALGAIAEIRRCLSAPAPPPRALYELTKTSIDAGPSVRNTLAMDENRCSCGASHADLVPAGVQEVDDREYLELGTCPVCGTTLCIRQWHLSSSAKWRASAPTRREPPSPSSFPASRG